jgi:iron complex transport system ATP-binding protein
LIELNSLTCKYFNKTILKNINLTIDSHLSILGANGSGKSTLAKAICGLIPYDGSIEINSKNIKELELKQRAKLIFYVPAKLESYDKYITVYEFVLLSRFSYKQTLFEYSHEDKEITNRALEDLNISHLKDHRLNSLSSGESALVLIAGSISAKSQIIIFDEPTANLDPKNSKIIANHIKRLKESHQIILITHDLHLASFINSPIGFVKNQSLKYFEDNFFDDENLQKLYNVKFKESVVVYE